MTSTSIHIETTDRTSFADVDIWTVKVTGVSALLGTELWTLVCTPEGAEEVVDPTGQHVGFDDLDSDLREALNDFLAFYG